MTTRLQHAAQAALAAAALFVAPVALATPAAERTQPAPRRHWVPEFDPAAGGALVALLAGGLLTVVNRRRSK